jgi:hypothetical protein
LVLATTVCDDARDEATSPEVCTLIGCSSGLVVELAGNVPETCAVQVSATTWEPRFFDCSDMVPEDAVLSLFLTDFSPGEVAVGIQWDGNLVVETFDPAYVVHQPNGPGCPPTCRIGTVRIVL